MFNYIDFKKGLASLGKEKNKILKRHYKLYDDLPILEQETFFTEYLCKFDPIIYKTPALLEEEFDWPLLLMVTAASFSSSYDFVFRDNDLIPDLVITVGNHETSITKSVDSLFYHQVNRLFQIYIEECINIQDLATESKYEKKAIDFERELRISTYNKKVNDIIMIKDYRESNIESEIQIRSLLSKYS